MTARPSAGLRGRMQVPGDKSISHRAVMLGALAIGETTISGLLEAGDVLRTVHAMAALGARLERHRDGAWHITGCGVGGFVEPPGPIDFGNSGTGVRLAAGLVATTPVKVIFTGDESLSRRPMGRVIEPLEQFGAAIATAPGGRLPMRVTGAAHPVPVTWELPVPSAQVKSALLLAGLNAPGETTVIEPVPTRDHTEKMLRAFGAGIEEERTPEGRRITLRGHKELSPCDLTVPGDPSSAAFPLAAALICPNSEVTVKGMLLNPTRTGLIETLHEMGADITIANPRASGGEIVGDVTARTSALRGVTVPAARAPAMIDEYPILAVLAAFAEGVTRMEGLAELRVKESDRIAATAAGLAACGVEVKTGDDWMEVTGRGGEVRGGGPIATHLDHRIAMSFLVLGLAAEEPVTVDDGAVIATSFPQFAERMRALGADIEPTEEAREG
ncbi:MAG TPA: 3-phosphoshikimate 1-carboxyvinyltransferase [Thermopetrobacter sp.]|nr:3-phosphoshikimate 1-carboxyvinyltransferase [Thermopetrobacter sp.]